MIQLQDAINYYHDLLADGLAADTQSEFFGKLKERGLYFGERPVCVVLRPHFYFEEQWRTMQKGMLALHDAFQRTYEACMASPELRAQLHLHDYEEALLPYETKVMAWTSSRVDTFYIPEQDSLKCVEYNAETPAGIGYGDMLSYAFGQLEVMRRFGERYQVRPMLAMDDLFGCLTRAYKAWGGVGMPQIVVADWTDVPTLNEHHMCKTHFEAGGAPTILADPRRLEYRDGHLWVDDFRVDVIYKRVLWSELIDVLGLDNPITQAIRDRAVLITNSISCKLLAKKASLAFMSDERNAHVFTPAQQTAITKHVPWTRVVEERKTIYDGASVDLMEFILDHRDRLVLKPNDEYGGKGVVIGWDTTDDEWNAALNAALHEPYVVQERVPIITRPFPLWVEDRLELPQYYVDADPYIFYGETVNGCLTRLSAKSLLNVTAGTGSVVPTFILRDG